MRLCAFQSFLGSQVIFSKESGQCHPEQPYPLANKPQPLFCATASSKSYALAVILSIVISPYKLYDVAIYRTNIRYRALQSFTVGAFYFKQEAMTDSSSEIRRTKIEQAFSQLKLSSALAQDTDKLVTQAIDWYTCVNPHLSPRKVRRKPRLIKDAVGDYLYIAGCNLKTIVETLPIDCDQDLLAQIASQHISKRVEQQYPDLSEAMQRAMSIKKQSKKAFPWQPFADTDDNVGITY